MLVIGGIGFGVMTMSGGSAAPVNPAVDKEASTELGAGGRAGGAGWGRTGLDGRERGELGGRGSPVAV